MVCVSFGNRKCSTGVRVVMLTMLTVVIFCAATVQSFLAPIPTTTIQNSYFAEKRRSHMMMIPLLTDVTPTSEPIYTTQIHTQSYVFSSQQYPSGGAVMDGIRVYRSNLESSSTTVSVTKEEIEQKKLTFNLVFWGGGFVAPLIATVFYFGFKFWEK